jgi:hypothetical protein
MDSIWGLSTAHLPVAAGVWLHTCSLLDDFRDWGRGRATSGAICALPPRTLHCLLPSRLSWSELFADLVVCLGLVQNVAFGRRAVQVALKGHWRRWLPLDSAEPLPAADRDQAGRRSIRASFSERLRLSGEMSSR